jgi:hypothetical protein
VTFKGEFILLIHRSSAPSIMGSELKVLAQDILLNHAGPKNIAKLLSLILERPTKDIYSELTKHKKE